MLVRAPFLNLKTCTS